MDVESAKPCVLCGKATTAFVHIIEQPMCPDCSARFEDYLAEKHGAPLPHPPLLYRYRAPSDVEPGKDGVPSRFEHFITSDQVWASNPRDFNDPYDCRQTHDFAAASREEWKRRNDRMIEQLRLGAKSLQDEEKLKALGVDMNDEAKCDDPAFQAGMERSTQEILDKVRVLCLCETQTNPRLWAHYSAGHRGFCLEFDTSMEPFHAFRVGYTRDYPKLPIDATSGQVLRTFLLTKSKLWKDEEEWRCLKVSGGPPQWSISKKALKAVIFGTRASPKLRTVIAQLIAKHKPWVELRQVVEVPFSYDIQVRPLQD